MTLESYAALMLSDEAVTLHAAAMAPSATPEDAQKWRTFHNAVQAALDPEPERRAFPPLRWICTPPDADPEWTVGGLLLSSGRIQLGDATYHRVTGRSSRGRATRHGRLWDPVEQIRIADEIIGADYVARRHREMALFVNHCAHRRAVAERLQVFVTSYRSGDGKVWRLIPNPTARRAAERCVPAALILSAIARAWIDLDVWAGGFDGYVSDADVQALKKVS